MKAILTRYLPCTNSRGSRIVATAEGGHRVTISYPHELGPGEDAHWPAAAALCRKLGWTGTLYGGCLPDGSYVFTFAAKYGANKREVKASAERVS